MHLDYAVKTPTVFRDPELQGEYEEQGYLVVDLLEEAELAALKNIAENGYTGKAGFWSSAIDPDHELRRTLAEAIIAICAPAVDRLTAGQRVVMGGLLAKAPSDSETVVLPHLDWSAVDESHGAAQQAWIPLAHTDPWTGGLFVLPRSHNLVNTPRGGPTYFPSAFDRLEPEQIREYGRFLSMRPGQGLLMDQRVVHWSPLNRGREPRFAIALLIVSREASLRYFHAEPDGTFHAYEIDDEFFRTVDVGDEPRGRYLGPLEVKPQYLDEETLRRVCAPEMALRPRPLAGANPRRRTLRSDKHQPRFEEDGFVTVPLLGRKELAALGALREEARNHRGGAYESAADPDLANRRRISEQIRTLCGPAIERLFADQEFLIGSLLVDPSTASRLATPHQGWTVVDEPRLVSCQVYFPLAFVPAEAGGLHVVPGSHRLVEAPRGTPHLPDQFDSLNDEQIRQFGSPVLLEPGQAVALDPRTIRWCSPTSSEESGALIVVTLAPRGAPLQHFFRRDDMRVHQYLVAKEFFLDHRVGEEPSGVDLGPISLGSHQLSVEDLSHVVPAAPSSVSTARRFADSLILRIPPGVADRVPPSIRRRLRAVARRVT